MTCANSSMRSTKVCDGARNGGRARCPVCSGRLAVGWHEKPLIYCFGSCEPTTDKLGNAVTVGDLVLASLGLRWGRVWGNDGSARRPTARRAPTAQHPPAPLTHFPASVRLRVGPHVYSLIHRNFDGSGSTADRVVDSCRASVLGWDGEAFAVPAWVDGRLAQFYGYDLEESWSQRKATSDRSTSRLVRSAPGQLILVCEGEFDAMVAWQAGLNAVGRPGASGRWRDEWTNLVAERHHVGLRGWTPSDAVPAKRMPTRY